MAAAGEIDLGQLSASQQEALQQYTQVTNQEIHDAVPLLRRSEWNVQIAIAKFFDGEGPDPLAEAIAADNRTRATTGYENLQESLSAPSQVARGQRAHRSEPAPRIVPPSQVLHRPPLLIALLLAPFNIANKLVSSMFRTVLYLLSFLPPSIRPRAVTERMSPGFRSATGRRMLMPRDTAWRFKREFEEEYGSISLPFFEGGVAQAQDLAKKDLKFLLIVLMSPEHDDNETFVKETLLAPEVVNYISDPANKIILWGGNILDSEAYQVSQEYNCTKFPFSALVCLTPKEGSTRMGIIKRMVGPTPAGEYLSELRAAMDKYTSDLDEARAERAAREAARSLRTEQDSAYERSLARDRERARQKREAAAAAAEAERKSKADAERAAHMEDLRQQWRRWRASTVAAEPDGSAKEVVRIALKMPEATGAGRIVRKFRSQSTMEDLYAFIECYDLVQSRQAAGFDDTLTKPTGYDHEYRFRLVSVMPRVVYEPSESTTIGEKIGRSGNLIVEDHTLESDGEDDD